MFFSKQTVFLKRKCELPHWLKSGTEYYESGPRGGSHFLNLPLYWFGTMREWNLICPIPLLSFEEPVAVECFSTVNTNRSLWTVTI